MTGSRSRSRRGFIVAEFDPLQAGFRRLGPGSCIPTRRSGNRRLPCALARLRGAPGRGSGGIRRRLSVGSASGSWLLASGNRGIDGSAARRAARRIVKRARKRAAPPMLWAMGVATLIFKLPAQIAASGVAARMARVGRAEHKPRNDPGQRRLLVPLPECGRKFDVRYGWWRLIATVAGRVAPLR